jgi:Arc/MetJ family transcription regulator
MAVKRKSHNLDEGLLRRAKRVLGAATETDAIHDALRAVLIGEEMVADLVRQMRAERRGPR